MTRRPPTSHISKPFSETRKGLRDISFPEVASYDSTYRLTFSLQSTFSEYAKNASVIAAEKCILHCFILNWHQFRRQKFPSFGYYTSKGITGISIPNNSCEISCIIFHFNTSDNMITWKKVVFCHSFRSCPANNYLFHFYFD